MFGSKPKKTPTAQPDVPYNVLLMTLDGTNTIKKMSASKPVSSLTYANFNTWVFENGGKAREFITEFNYYKPGERTPIATTASIVGKNINYTAIPKVIKIIVSTDSISVTKDFDVSAPSITIDDILKKLLDRDYAQKFNGITFMGTPIRDLKLDVNIKPESMISLNRPYQKIEITAGTTREALFGEPISRYERREFVSARDKAARQGVQKMALEADTRANYNEVTPFWEIYISNYVNENNWRGLISFVTNVWPKWNLEAFEEEFNKKYKQHFGESRQRGKLSPDEVKAYEIEYNNEFGTNYGEGRMIEIPGDPYYGNGQPTQKWDENRIPDNLLWKKENEIITPVLKNSDDSPGEPIPDKYSQGGVHYADPIILECFGKFVKAKKSTFGNDIPDQINRDLENYAKTVYPGEFEIMEKFWGTFNQLTKREYEEMYFYKYIWQCSLYFYQQ